jgi:hypothetical protein
MVHCSTISTESIKNNPMKINIGWVFLYCLILNPGGGLVMAGDGSPLTIAQNTATPAASPKPASTATPTPAPTATPKPSPTATPTPTSTPTPTPPSTVTPQPSPTTPAAQPTTVPLSEKASYIGTCRSIGVEALKVYADTAQTQEVSELPAFSKITLTGVLGQGIAQISQPAMGWVKTANLSTNCEARPKTQ